MSADGGGDPEVHGRRWNPVTTRRIVLTGLALVAIVSGALYRFAASRDPFPTGHPGPVSPTRLAIAPSPGVEPSQANSDPSVTLNVISVGDDTITGIFSGGCYAFPVAPGATLPNPLETGKTLEARCAITPQGGWIILGGYRHHGLPLAFGTVTARTATRLALDTPFGSQSLAVNSDSDLPADLAVGTFVNVKYYHNLGVPTVLNCHKNQGCFVETGLLTAKDRESFTVRSLRATLTFRATPTSLDHIPRGANVTFRYRLDAGDRLVPLALERLGGPLSFTGKIPDRPARIGTLNVLDVFGDTPGEMHFNCEGQLHALDQLGAGDLVTVVYEMREQGLPLVRSVEKKALKPVYFGTIIDIDEQRIRLVTRQGRERELRITRQTAIPEPLATGEMVDVIYREEGVGMPRATGIFKK